MSALTLVGLVVVSLVVTFLCWIFLCVCKVYGWKVALATIIFSPLGLIIFVPMNILARRREKRLIIVKAIELFEGNKKNAFEWLKNPNRALGGITPLRAIKQGRGEDVRHLIGRLEHGVYS